MNCLDDYEVVQEKHTLYSHLDIRVARSQRKPDETLAKKRNKVQ